MTCPNARRSSVHLPRLAAARDQALTPSAKAQTTMPPLQRAALAEYTADLDRLLAEIEARSGDHDKQEPCSA